MALLRRGAFFIELYIERCSELLRFSPNELARAVTGFGEREDVMFQNSPGVGAWS